MQNLNFFKFKYFLILKKFSYSDFDFIFRFCILYCLAQSTYFWDTLFVSVLKSGIQVHTSNIIRKLTSFVRGIKIGYTYCCNQRVFFTFFGGRNQRCMNQNQFWCQNVFKDVKLSNLIFPLVRVQQTYRNCMMSVLG